MSDSLWPHELQHTRPPCLTPTPGAYPNACPLSQWCHPTISSSVVPFSSCPQSFPASGSFQMSQLFASGGQTIGVSASTSDLPKNTQDWSPLGWTGWISLQSKGLSRVFSNTTVQKLNSSVLSFLCSPTTHPYMTTGKTIALIRWTFDGKVMSLFFNMLSAAASKYFSCVWLCVTPQIAAHQALPFQGFSRQEHWSGLPFPTPMRESEKWKWSRSVMAES